MNFQSKILPILFLIVVALILRVPLLNQSFWLDEAAQALQSSRPLSQQLNIAYDFQPPLLHLLTFSMIQISTAEWWLRLTSVIAGVGTVVFTYLIGKKFLSPKYALIAGLLLATHSLHIFFSQELRPYSLACLWAVVSWYSLIEIVDRKKSHKTVSIVFLYIFSSIAGLYSTYLYPFLLFSQGVYIVFFQRSFFKKFLLSWSLIVLGFLPWIPFLFHQLQVSNALRANTAGWEDVVSFDQVKSIPLVFGKFLYGVLYLDVSVFIVITGILIFLSFGFVLKHIPKTARQNDQTVLLLLTWLVVPLATSWLVSFFVPLVQPKRVLFLLPALIILIIYSLSISQIKRKFKIGIVSLLFGIQFFSLIQYWTQPIYQRENWRTLITSINQQFSPSNTIVVFGFDEPFAPWLWYQDQPFPVVLTGTKTIENISEIDEGMKPVLNYEFVLVFDYLRDLTDPNRNIDLWLEEYDYQGVGVFDYSHIGFVRILRKGKAATVANQNISIR